MILFEHDGLSVTGPVRDANEDFIACHVPEEAALRHRKGCLLVVADGVGGRRAGDVASREATGKLIESYYASSGKPLAALRSAFEQANLHVCDLGMTKPEYRRMETTLSALLLVGSHAYIGHVGDTRIYRCRSGSIEQLTQDHSEVGELVRLQILTPEEAQHHPRRHVITRSLGSELMMHPDFRTETLAPGDSFVLCSDGVWEPLSPTEILEAAGQRTHAACQGLVDSAIARGSTDNLSVHVLQVLEVPVPTPEAGFFKRALSRLGGTRLWPSD